MISAQVYAVCLGILVLITTSVTYRAFLDRERPGSRTFGFLTSAITAWIFFYLMEIVLSDFPNKLMARKLLYAGMSMVAPLWLAFALRYTAFSKWWAQSGRIGLLTIPAVVATFLAATNEKHYLIWQSLKMPDGNSMGPLHLTYGGASYAFEFFAHLFFAAGCAIYLVVYFRSPKYFRKQMGMILLGISVILISNAILMGILQPELDPMSFAFGLSVPLFAAGFFRFGLFNLLPIAAPVIIENLRDAVIVADEQDRVTKINLAAKQWFNLNDDSVGAFVFDILPKRDLFEEKWEAANAKIKFKTENGATQASYDAAITRLHDNEGNPLGRVVVIHDITQEQELLEAEFRHSAQLGLLEEVGRNITESLNEREILERSIRAMDEYFGFAEVAISLLTKDNQLELVAIGGKEDFGYKPQYKQDMGKGIIGHTAEIRATYIARDVASDPYYFSSDVRAGSAICLPLLNENNLLGVLYVESDKPDDFSAEDVQMLETLAKQISSAMQRARLYAETREHLQVMSAVQSLSRVVLSSLDLKEIYASVLDVLKESFGYKYVSIYLLEGETLHLGAQYGYAEEHAPSEISIYRGVSGRTVRSKQPQFIQDVAADPDFMRFSEEITHEICVPLLKKDAVLGVLNVEGNLDAPLTQQDADTLTALAGSMALAIDNARLHEQVKIASVTDPVSGLHNRRFFEDTLRVEIERATRSGNPLSLIIFDIDSFKDYNDAWGHPAGDARLKATADLVSKNLRKYDLAARYGGDEFAIILPDTDRKGARKFATRLLKAVRDSAPHPIAKNEWVPGYTLSIGVATFPKDGDTFSSLVLAADHAELIAKRLGKNRIIAARELKR